MSEYSDYLYDELAYVPIENWPFDTENITESIQKANKLAPTGTFWMYSATDTPSYHLVNQHTEASYNE